MGASGAAARLPLLLPLRALSFALPLACLAVRRWWRRGRRAIRHDRQPTSLDPPDANSWAELRRLAHSLLDASLDRMESALDGRVWTPLPKSMREELEVELPPTTPLARGELVARLRALLPYGVGNTHPRFFGWVHGSGCPGVVLPELVAAAINANCGGRDHAAIHVEQQVLRWSRTIMGFPADSGALLVSGTSMATLVALKVARDVHCAHACRKDGVTSAGRLVGYTSDQAHSCLDLAFDILGLGSDQLRKVTCHEATFEMDLVALAELVNADRRAGLIPFFVAGTAGTVGVGSIDDLEGIADFCQREQLWFHVDGAFGAAAILSPLIAPRLSGLHRADSLAFDFHKWFHVAYDAGCVLVRDGDAHLRSFHNRADYLLNNLSGNAGGRERGIAAGRTWPTDFGPELSRGFRALKVWSHLLEHGTDALGATISSNVHLAAQLARLVDSAPNLHRLAPTALNIVVFRYEPTVGSRSTPDDRDDTPRTAQCKVQAAAYDALEKPNRQTHFTQGSVRLDSANVLRCRSSLLAERHGNITPKSIRPSASTSPSRRKSLNHLRPNDGAPAAEAPSSILARDAIGAVSAGIYSHSPSSVLGEMARRRSSENGRGSSISEAIADSATDNRPATREHSNTDACSTSPGKSPGTPSRLNGCVEFNGSPLSLPSIQRACSAATANSTIHREAEVESALDALNDAIVVELQERGVAAPSTTRVRGRLAIRVNLTNHRTRPSDLELLLQAVRELGAELAPRWPVLLSPPLFEPTARHA